MEILSSITAVFLEFIMIKKLVLIFLSIWWGATVLVDFTVVPTVFQVIENFFNAGELGMALFSKVNKLELILSSLLVGLSSLHVKRSKRSLIEFCLILSASLIVLTYFSYLTPKISELTLLWKKADSLGLVGISGIMDIQQEHQLYHRIYVSLDTLKLLLLSVLIVLRLTEKTEENAKA